MSNEPKSPAPASVPSASADRPISELFALGRPLRSLEFFPPKDDAGVEALRATATALKRMNPDFVSVTYGAGGTTRDRTAQVCDFLKRDFGFTVMPHLTCVGHSREELSTVADRIHASGFRNIMTLRGDPPKGQTEFTAHPEGFAHAMGLVDLIRRERPGRFAIGVAGFPERHPSSPDDLSDIRHLAGKVAAGADFVTTQLFLDNEDYFRFVARARAAGISVPILPGIMPVLSLKQARRFCGFCRAKIPAALIQELEACGEDEEAQRKVGVSWAVRQVRGLLGRGVPGYHVYILNRSQSALELFAQLKF